MSILDLQLDSDQRFTICVLRRGHVIVERMETSGAPTLTAAANEFLESVLRLAPRVAAFDCDGTLWSGDAGETFFDWEIRRGVVSAEVALAMRARHAEYKTGKVSEDDMCGEMVTMHCGISEAEMMQAASEFMTQSFPGRIFPEMQELVRRLSENGCEVWAVSSSNEWVIRAGMQQFGIAADRILAAKVAVDNGVVTDRLIRVPSGPGKPRALREVVRKEIDAAFGNSRWDAEMLAIAQNAFAVNPNPDLAAKARERRWTIYFPDGTGAR
jgi:HAD superfamily phosphoserine phosphatase-like hydrolase